MGHVRVADVLVVVLAAAAVAEELMAEAAALEEELGPVLDGVGGVREKAVSGAMADPTTRPLKMEKSNWLRAAVCWKCTQTDTAFYVALTTTTHGKEVTRLFRGQ